MSLTTVKLGYAIYFPKFSQSDVDFYRLSSEKAFKTYPDYELFKKNTTKITRLLRFKLSGTVKKTSIRISDEVKMHLPDFHFIRSKGIEIL